jgi:glycosyltransferase involved in cell wall biosynthesis
LTDDKSPPRPESVGLAHDYLLVLRGAERTFAAIADLFPAAPVYTLLYDEEGTRGRFARHEVVTSYLQRLGVGQEGFQRLLPLFPRAVERLPLGGHDAILSSSSAFAHGLRPGDGAVHVCYCHTPFRYAWYAREAGLAQAPRPLRPLVGRSLNRIRRWDRGVAQRRTHYVANSLITQERLRRYWGRDAPVVHPPVELDRFAPGEPGDYFLVVGELVRHKRTEVALEAARLAGVPIKVVGTGAHEAQLRARYGDGAEFLGRVGDGELAAVYAGARALVMPNVEEFGITAVEAQASGRPVLAADGGGARETVLEGETGIFVPPDDPRALSRAMKSPELERMEPARALASARRFSVEAFQRGISSQLAAALAGE